MQYTKEGGGVREVLVVLLLDVVSESEGHAQQADEESHAAPRHDYYDLDSR